MQPIDRPDSPQQPSPRPPPARGGRRGRATRRLDPDHPCLNCGDPSWGEYCPRCGQRKLDVHVSIRTMVGEALEEELFVDRRLPTTLGALLFRPGRLTVEYVNGRVVRYIRPLRLYLVSSLLFFLLLSFTSLRLVRGFAADPAPTPVTADTVLVTLTSTEIEEALENVRADLARPDLTAAVRDSLRTLRNDLTRQQAILARRSADPPGAPEAEPADEEPAPGPAEPAPPADPGPAAAQGPEAAPRPGAGAAASSWRVGHPVLDSLANARFAELQAMDTRQAVERVVRNLVGYIPTMMFVLVPLFALVLKVLYVRRRRYYAEHFVFLLHTHAFVYLMFLAMLGLMLTGWAGPWLMLGIVGWMTFYVYAAMRRVYGQGRLKTLLKMTVLGWSYFTILAASLPIVALIAVLLL